MNTLVEDLKKADQLVDKVQQLVHELDDIIFSIKYDIDNENNSDELSDVENEKFENYFKEVVINSINEDQWDMDDDERKKQYEENPEETAAFIRGCCFGYWSALFSICDRVHLMDFFEKEVLPRLKFHHENP